MLAGRLTRRGYAIEAGTGKKGRYFELGGVPGALRTALSGRSREVLNRARALELATGRRVRGGALAVLAKETRAEKSRVDATQVTSWWDAMASEHGFSRAAAEALRREPRALGSAADGRAVADAIMRRLAEEGPTVRTAEARAIALESAAGRMGPEEAVKLLSRLQELGLVIALEDDRVTTQPIRELELAVLRVCRGQRTAEPGPLEAHVVASGVSAAERISVMARPWIPNSSLR